MDETAKLPETEWAFNKMVFLETVQEVNIGYGKIVLLDLSDEVKMLCPYTRKRKTIKNDLLTILCL